MDILEDLMDILEDLMDTLEDLMDIMSNMTLEDSEPPSWRTPSWRTPPKKSDFLQDLEAPLRSVPAPLYLKFSLNFRLNFRQKGPRGLSPRLSPREIPQRPAAEAARPRSGGPPKLIPGCPPLAAPRSRPAQKRLTESRSPPPLPPRHRNASVGRPPSPWGPRGPSRDALGGTRNAIAGTHVTRVTRVR